MRKKIVCIAHPTQSGAKAALNSIPEEYAVAMVADGECLKRGVVDEMWLYGDRVSEEMKEKVKLAWKFGIRIVPKTKETAVELFKMERQKAKLLRE